MEENKKSNLTKRHFAKFHERIQNKYAQMQMRMEKSRSMESISSLGEEFITDKKSLVKCEEEEMIAKVKSVEEDIKYSVTVEEVSKQDAIAKDCEDILLSEVNSVMQDDDDDDDVFNSLNSSFENVYEESIEQELHADEVSLAPSRITVRERIQAVRERRREKQEKKKEEKRNMSDSSHGSDKKKEHKTKVSDSSNNSDKFVLSNKPVDVSKRRNKIAAVSVALVEATGPEDDTAQDEKARQFYCRIRLGQEKYKSKPVKIDENKASWQELFNFSLYEDTSNMLEITMWEKEKDVFVGRTIVDLSQLEHYKTYKMDLRLEEDVPVQILILVCISSMTQDNVIDCEERHNEIMEMKKNVSWMLLNDDFEYVGKLQLTVHRAIGLNTSDCFVVIVVGNDRFQTHTEHKTHDPVWMKTFTFVLRDATSIMYVTIYDEKKTDIVGKLAIPLLSINNGELKWFALKNKTCRDRAKGNNPRILLQMSLYFNFLKQSIRLINPREKILLEVEPEFSRQRLSKNITRMRAVFDWTTAAFKVTKTLFEWESQTLNVITLTGWLLFWYFYQAWMLPLLLLMPFFWYRPKEYHFTSWKPEVMWKPLGHHRSESTISLSSSTSLKKESSLSTFRQKINNVTEMVKTIQNGIGSAASLGETVKNLFNFTVPFISFFSIAGIFALSIVLYYIQSRYLIMAWGIHKFLRKILRPKRIPNNELLDLLSRIPDDETLLDCKELPLLSEDHDKKHKTLSISN